MISICRLPLLCAVPFATLCCSLQAQVVERVMLYRDAAVVTWKVEVENESQPLARTLFPVGNRQIHVMPVRAEVPLGAVFVRQMEWSSVPPNRRQIAIDQVDGLRVDAALKQAQLDIVEEDLAVLRANRDIGGTAESLLAEDLEEMADWMHDAFREVLYRRAELDEELAELNQNHEKALDDLETLSPAPAFEWVIQMPNGLGETIRTQVVETQGAGWDPVDQISLNQDGSPSTWFQRISFRLSVPHSGKAEIVFVDEWWSDHITRSSSYPGVALPGSAGKTKVNAGKNTAAGDDRDSIRKGRRSRYAPGVPVEAGMQSGGTVNVGMWDVEFTRNAISEPQVAEVIDTWYTTSTAGKSIVRADQVQVVLDGTPLGPRSVIHEGDSVMLIAGNDADWSVTRSEEAGLCSRLDMGNRIRHHRAYTILLSNRSDYDGRVHVVESLPRSRQLEIELNPENLDGASINPVSETLHWSVQLKAGESRTLRFSYDVEHERDVRVSGYH